MARNFTLIHELDSTSYEVMRKVRLETDDFMSNVVSFTKEERKARLIKISALFKSCLKHGHDKVELAVQTYDMVDRHIRRLDDDLMKFEEEQMTGPKVLPSHSQPREDPRQYRSEKLTRETGSSRLSRRAQSGIGQVALPEVDTPTKKRRVPDDERPPLNESPVATPVSSTPQKPIVAPVPKPLVSAVSKKSSIKSKKTSTNVTPVPTPPMEVKIGKELVPVDLEIDPNEPTYCICKQVSFGEMIACDNDDCPIEWFHYTCVGLTDPVKGKWFCPICVEKRKI
ncbi:hypothetical protein BATDEDRAFT_35913 [Batrachochytrium dendrobatidis JAM81]|uniref:Chromatin modification-related protein n=2 Tax=Batrachochytrium dendrobatidis TaxID=109871 RepID=F4PAL3_BATDJ|nr:uncharacterized protein BATDEDRAFT_35913 [Batrachochytrium dendrobatidis JAM81]EGF77561.1 hypothetical protein BATDEDRAFT_35913 [Batrachochytrium dendrobatidis JAM81]OAJ43293.1 hypothetical protein BDEG_26664 [Batrachochytrium dendrobatidis JEL423]|eukprot:XP_006681717.1 hypothetical protein BATDEDRAFT_35913 [Batrachochytrium dendrobatidis JAM81]